MSTADWESKTTQRALSMRETYTGDFDALLERAKALDEARANAYWQAAGRLRELLGQVENRASSREYVAAARAAAESIEIPSDPALAIVAREARDLFERTRVAEIVEAARAWSELSQQFASQHGSPEQAAREIAARPESFSDPIRDAVRFASDFPAFLEETRLRIGDNQVTPEIVNRIAGTSTFAEALRFMANDTLAAVESQRLAPDEVARALATAEPMLRRNEKLAGAIESDEGMRQRFARYVMGRHAYLNLTAFMDEHAATLAADRGISEDEAYRAIRQSAARLHQAVEELRSGLPEGGGLPMPPKPTERAPGAPGLAQSVLRGVAEFFGPVVEARLAKSPGGPEAALFERSIVNTQLPRGQMPKRLAWVIPANLETIVSDVTKLGLSLPFFAAGGAMFAGPATRAATAVGARLPVGPAGLRALQTGGRVGAAVGGGEAISPEPRTLEERLARVAGGSVIGGALGAGASRVGAAVRRAVGARGATRPTLPVPVQRAIPRVREIKGPGPARPTIEQGPGARIRLRETAEGVRAARIRPEVLARFVPEKPTGPERLRARLAAGRARLAGEISTREHAAIIEALQPEPRPLTGLPNRRQPFRPPERTKLNLPKMAREVPETTTGRVARRGRLRETAKRLRALRGLEERVVTPDVTARFPVRETPTRGVPPSLRQVHSQINRALGASVRVQRQRSGVLGKFEPPTGATSVGRADNLPTMLHEAGHRMDFHLGIRKNAPKAAMRELERADFSSTVPEGAPLELAQAERLGEFTRAYFLDPDYARALAPKFAAHFEKSLGSTLSEWAKVTDAIGRVKGADPLLRSAVNVELPSEFQRGNWWDRLLGRTEHLSVDRLPFGASDFWHSGFQNKFRAATAARRFYEKVTKRKVVPSTDPHIRLTNHLAYRSTVGEMAESGFRNARGRLVPDPKTGEVMNGAWLYDPLAKLTRAGSRSEAEWIKAIDAVLVAGRGIERRQRTGQAIVTGAGLGIESEAGVQARTLLALRQLPARERRLVVEAARRYRALMDAALQRTVSSGRLSIEAYRRMLDSGQHYANLTRLREVTPGDELSSLLTKPLKKFKGSTRTISSPYMTAYAAVADLEREASFNAFKRSLAHLARPPGRRYSGEYLELHRIGQFVEKGEPGATVYFDHGKPRYIRFDPVIRKMLDHVARYENRIPRAFRLPAQILRTTVTSTVEFALRNFGRDLMDTLVKSADPRFVPRRPLRALTVTRAERAEFRARGGGQFGFYSNSPHDWEKWSKAMVEDLIDQGKTVVLDPRKLARRAWRDYENQLLQSELRPKVAEYLRLKERAMKEFGYDEFQAHTFAMKRSRELTDFLMIGSWMDVPSQVTAFLNASIQGIYSSLLAIRRRPVLTLSRGFTLASGLVAMEEAVNRELGTIDELRRLPAWRRDLFINIPTGNSKVPWAVLPIGWFAGAFRALVRRMWEFAETGDKLVWKGVGESMWRSFVPFEDVTALTGPLTTAVQIRHNYDDFQDREIIPFWERPLAPEKRKGAERASRMGKAMANYTTWLTKHAGIDDPRQYDFIAERQFGLVGRFVRDVSDLGREERRKPSFLGVLRTTPGVTPAIEEAVKEARRQGIYGKSEFKTLRRLRGEIFEETPGPRRDRLIDQADREARRLLRDLERR